MLTEEEVMYMFAAYNRGEMSFGEVILASGWSVKGLCELIKREGIEININMGFLKEGGLDEDTLKFMLDNMND